MKILADSVIPWVDKLFAQYGEIIRYSGREVDQTQLQDIDILLTRSTLKITGDLLENTPVKFVASATVGCDHVNQAELKELGIKFVYAPGCNANAVCEYVVCAIAWHEKEGLTSFGDDLTAAVIGCGKIGSKVKEKLEILGFDVVVNDPPLAHQTTKDWNFADLEQALQADVICMHTPLIKTGEHPTYHLLDEKQLERINPNAILINAGRGEVINNSALLEKLNKNPQLNIVLDVWENEPNISQKLLQKVNLGTPHIAGHSWRGKVMGTVMIYQQACEYFNWLPQEINEDDFRVPVPNLQFTNDLSIYDVLAQCYDIQSDARILHAQLSSLQTNTGFDKLRKNYYQRPEFSDLKIKMPSCVSKGFLEALGFNVQGGFKISHVKIIDNS